MAMAGPGRRQGHQAGPAPLGEAPESPGGPGAELTAGEERPAGSGLEPELEPEREPEPELELEELLAKDEEQLEARGPRPPPPVPPLRASHGLKRKPAKAEAEPQLQHTDLRRPLLRKEDSDAVQGEASAPAKQHKKAKKRKSVGAPPVATAPATPAAAEALGLERRAQRLRPLYQYINHSNPELNQAGEGEAEVKVELGLVPEEASGGAEETGAPPGEEGGEEPVPILSFPPGSQLKAEVDKSTQVDIDKMLSVCAAHLVPPLSPQYK